MQPVQFEISLGLVTYNQSEFLKIFLGNYLNFGQPKLPLIIIDDGSTDQTWATLQEIQGENNITLKRIEHSSIAHARNQVLSLVNTEWLAFADTDCILNELYYNLITHIPGRYKNATAIEGSIKYTPDVKPIFSHSLANENGGMFPTANMIFNVKQVLELGGFDERFKNFREDVDLALEVLAKKGPIPFCKELVVYHPHVPKKFIPALTKAWVRHQNIISSEILLYTKHPKSYGVVRHFSNARSTIVHWFLFYLVSSSKEIYFNFKSKTKNTARTPQMEITALLKNLIVIFWEQICIYILCLVKINQIRKLTHQ